jgi:hypothetical protein
MKCTQRLYLTADRKKLVPAGDKKAATLYAVPGDEIPKSAADRFGLVDGHLKGFDPGKEDRGGGDKEKQGGRDKEKKGGADKGGGQGGGSKSAADDLTSIAGIGPATAKALANGGVGTFAALAEVDPDNAPFSDGLPPAFNWKAVADAAKAKFAASKPAEG